MTNEQIVELLNKLHRMAQLNRQSINLIEEALRKLEDRVSRLKGVMQSDSKISS